MTPQEIFETSVNALLKQGERSVVDSFLGDKMCRYVGPNGLRCAVGHLLPDDIAHKADDLLDGRITGVVREIGYSLPNHIVDNVGLLSALQFMHDSASDENFIFDLRLMAKNVAKRFNLETSFMDETE